MSVASGASIAPDAELSPLVETHSADADVAVGDGVVGAGSGAAVGAKSGAAVGAGSGAAVGAGSGTAVFAEVGTAVGAAVGVAVTSGPVSVRVGGLLDSRAPR